MRLCYPISIVSVQYISPITEPTNFCASGLCSRSQRGNVQDTTHDVFDSLFTVSSSISSCCEILHTWTNRWKCFYRRPFKGTVYLKQITGVQLPWRRLSISETEVLKFFIKLPRTTTYFFWNNHVFFCDSF